MPVENSGDGSDVEDIQIEVQTNTRRPMSSSKMVASSNQVIKTICNRKSLTTMACYKNRFDPNSSEEEDDQQITQQR